MAQNALDVRFVHQKQTHAPQQIVLFNYLIGAREQRLRHDEAECLGRLKVDHQLELVRRLTIGSWVGAARRANV